MPLNEKLITDLLALRHCKDLFVPQCKTGASVAGAPLRLDAWAMRKSWTRPQTIGYEIKCSRTDFINDEKWMGYLDYCTQFYFVSPPKLIAVDECPEESGLIWCSVNGTRLYTKKRAPIRRITIPEDIFRYILMWRVKVVADLREQRGDRAAAWREELDEWEKNRRLGRMIGQLVAQRADIRAGTTVAEVKRLRRRLDNLRQVDKFLKELGVDPGYYESGWRNILDDVQRRLVPDRDEFVRLVSRVEQECAEIRRRLEVSGE